MLALQRRVAVFFSAGRRWGGRCRAAGRGRFFQVKDNVKLAAPALFAADRDRSIHRVHNALGNRHAQPGTLGFPHAGVVLPAEGLKYHLLIRF